MEVPERRRPRLRASWDVWNQLDYTRYRDHSPRFASEFGRQAPPSWQTLRSSISDAVLAPDSPGMAHHQKATDGDLKLGRGLAAHLGVPTISMPGGSARS
jgi:beta-mannosidase